MQREHPVKADGGCYCDHIVESAKELQDDSQWDPDTVDLATTDERYTETRTEVRNGREITIRRKGVRPKMASAQASKPAQEESDGLNKMNDADLETGAAKVGVVNYPKNATRAKRVAAIREAMTAKV